MITQQLQGNQPPSPEIQAAAARVQEVMQERATPDIIKALTGDDTLAVIALVNTLKEQGSVDKNWPDVNVYVPEVPMGAPEGFKVQVAPRDFATAVLMTGLRISSGKDGKMEYLPESADEIAFGLWHVTDGVMWTWEYENERLRALIGPGYDKGTRVLEDIKNARTGVSNDAEIQFASLFTSLWRALGESIDEISRDKVSAAVEQTSGMSREALANVSNDARIAALCGLLARTPAYRVSRVVGHVCTYGEDGSKGTDSFFCLVLHGAQEIKDDPELLRSAVLEVVQKSNIIPESLLVITDTSNAFGIYDDSPQWERIPACAWHRTDLANEVLDKWGAILDGDRAPRGQAKEDKWAGQKQKFGSAGLQQSPPPAADAETESE